MLASTKPKGEGGSAVNSKIAACYCSRTGEAGGLAGGLPFQGVLVHSKECGRPSHLYSMCVLRAFMVDS